MTEKVGDFILQRLSDWGIRRVFGYPKFPSAQDVEAFPYAVYAEMLGFKGIRVDSQEGIGAAWEEALRANRPVLIEFITDPDVPPLPPHITWSQAKAYMTALAKADPDRLGVIKQSTRQALAGLFSSGKDGESD
ncbi:hypothetical protein [Dyella acidiphila]|uniref:Uncharacterized protein n=1 Tax=Dyella acidiphila TaxID=2775866 RepID=A0ABR9GCT6_9GAMM|nr:hypothetical protein [Dyella acidiphila]MBE1161843.1 hypothetical protein [Dyella acidiphila]